MNDGPNCSEGAEQGQEAGHTESEDFTSADKPTGSTTARVKGELPFQEGGPFGETAEDGGEGAVRA